MEEDDIVLGTSFPDSDRLRCPCCGANELHHHRVDTFFRNCEDSDQGNYTASSANLAVADSGAHMHDNPSSRRDGLRVRFWCEHCDGRPHMVLVQHKGATYMYWESHRTSFKE